MAFSTLFLLESPQLAIDELVRQFNGAHTELPSHIVSTFQRHFDNDHILLTIPHHVSKPPAGKLARMYVSVQQNGLETEYFIGKCGSENFGYFRMSEEGEEITDAAGPFASRKSVHCSVLSDRHQLHGSQIRTHYYDDHLDDIPLNSVLELIGIYEIIDDSDPVFHIIFSHPIPHSINRLDSLLACQHGSPAIDLLMSWLVSRPAKRTPDGLAIGAVSLNITGVSNDSDYSLITRFVHSAFPIVQEIKCSLPSLSSCGTLFPVFDADSGILRPNHLQLPTGSAIIIDERDMAEGKLDETATRNIDAIIQIAASQRCPYEFPFGGTVEIDVDYPVLIVSKEKSIISCSWHVPHDTIRDELVSLSLPESVYHEIRLVRQREASIDTAMAEHIEADLVQLRRQKAMHESCMHAHLTLARLLAVRSGRDKVETADWERSKLVKNLI